MAELEAFMKERVKKNAFTNYNHIVVESIEEDGGILRLDIHPESKNPHGMVHGGAMYTMADSAAGLAAHMDGRLHVTQSSNLSFLGNQAEGSIWARSHVRHRGKTTSLISVDIVGDNGRLLATGDFTFFCIGEQNAE